MKKLVHRFRKEGRSLTGTILLFYVFPALLMAACVIKAKDLDNPKAKRSVVITQAKPADVPVDGQIVRPARINDNLEVTGTLVANQQVEIVSELTRRVVRVAVSDGAFVKQGDLLFQLDDADLQAQLERYQQQEKLAGLNEQRLKDLIAHEAIAQQDYDEAATNLKVLQAQITETEVTIRKTRITAPFNGQVGMVRVHQGAVVSLSTPLLNIQDNSVIKVEFSVPEKYASLIRLNSEQIFTITSDQKRYTAKVVARGSSLDQNTRTLLIRATTPNDDGHLLPGQSARISLALNTAENSLAVYSQALIPSSTGYTLLVSHKNVVQPVAVEIGQRAAGSVEITKGLTAGDTVIISNLLRLTPGANVDFVTLK